MDEVKSIGEFRSSSAKLGRDGSDPKSRSFSSRSTGVSRFAQDDKVVVDKVVDDKLVGDEVVGDGLVGDEVVGDNFVAEKVVSGGEQGGRDRVPVE
jgi:hypothetical protein